VVKEPPPNALVPGWAGRTRAATWLPGFLANDPAQPAWLRFVIELHAFAWHQALSCLFPVFIFAMLGATHFTTLGLLRYDLLLLLCIALQALMYVARMETRDEVKVIGLFHLLGLALEIWKVHLGSWSYPGEAWTKVAGVPLFGGFMYASVASYICQAWRRLRLRFHGWPPTWVCCLIAAGIYVNFYTNRFLPDARWALFAAVALCFARARVVYVNNGPERRMPVLLSFLLIGLFIWLAENIATFLGAWRYPNQHHGWQPVYWQKLTSWWLLVIVSIVIVAELKRLKGRLTEGTTVFTRVQP
jgi:uncharacterized membrane protein YoaT (DUF817 family)